MQINQSAAAAFNSMHEGVTIIDKDGVIIFGNTAYLEFIKRDTGMPDDIKGRRLRDLRPGAKLPDVLVSGKPILHQTRKEIKDFYFVNMYPIYENGQLVGGISIVTFLEEAYHAREELEAMEQRSRQVLHSINKANGAGYTFDDIIAVSPKAMATKELAKRIAATDATVLLEGESGVGKELYAQSIHNASKRSQSVFVAINCANFNANMLESELFGYVEGAFTGAKKGGSIGLFEAAAGGTLFLDEISEMDLGLQASLLRILQERKIRPVGSVREVDVDVRVIAACNVNLSNYVEEGRFRKDLYFRLSVFPIQIPTLSECRENIPALANVLLSDLSHKLHRPFSLTVDALDILRRHHWPGNVRELRNVLEFSAYLTPTGMIDSNSLPAGLGGHRTDIQGSTCLGEQNTNGQNASLDVFNSNSQDTCLEALGSNGQNACKNQQIAGEKTLTLSQRTKSFEKQEILKLLAENGSSLMGKKKTAAQLGISLASLYNKLNK